MAIELDKGERKIMKRASNQARTKPGISEKRWLTQQVPVKSTHRRARSALSTVFGGAMIVLLALGLALLVIIGHPNKNAVIASQGPQSLTVTVPSGYGSLNHPKGPCGNQGQAPCQPVQPNWFPITSEAPNAVATAIAHSIDYRSMQSRYGYVALDTPTLIHAFGAHTGIAYYDDDHWVVSVKNTAGMRCGVFDFVYDRANHRSRFSSYGVITPVDPNRKLAFPYISAATAAHVLQSRLGLQVMAGTQPELIFFPINPNFPILTSPVHTWSGGGNSPMLPMWLLVGSDRQNYFVGIDLGVYSQSTLPIATGQP